MKRLIIAFSAFFALCSCVKESPDCGLIPDFEIKASSDITRTSYSGAGELVWSYGERINIFDGTASREFTTYVSEPRATASFFGPVSSSWTTLVGVYPYNESNELLPGGKVRIEFPSYQTAFPGGFTDAANVAIGETSSASGLLLRNAGAYLRLAFTSSTAVRAIYIASNTEGCNLSGTMTFKASTAGLADSSEGLNCVTLIPEGESIAPGTYYAVVAPVTLERGLRIFFRLSDGRLVGKMGESDLVLSRNATVDLGTLDVDALETVSETSLETVTITLDFTAADKAFTEKLPSTRMTGSRQYQTKNGGYSVGFLVNPVQEGGNTRGQGWVSAGTYLALMTNNSWKDGNRVFLDGITFPAISGKRLVSVEYVAPSNTFAMNVTDRNSWTVFYDDDYETMPSDKYNSSENWLKGSHIFSLPASAIGESYRLVARKSNSFCYISYLVLSYETIVSRSIPALFKPDPSRGKSDAGLDNLGFDPVTDDGDLK